MFINKLNINNFGKLADTHINFEKGLNIIYASNEAGKTTVFSFIKYIFYGTKQKKSYGDLTFKERYTPWDGSHIEGSMQITSNGDYMVQRSESEQGSKLIVVDLKRGQEQKDIKTPGDYFMGIGERAFADSCYVQNILSLIDGNTDGELISVFLNPENNGTYMKIKKSLNERLANLVSAKRKSSRLSVIEADINRNKENLRYINESVKEVQSKINEVENNEQLIKKHKENIEILKSKKLTLQKEKNQTDLAKLQKEKDELNCELNKIKADVTPYKQKLYKFLSVFSLIASALLLIISFKNVVFVPFSVLSLLVFGYSFVRLSDSKSNVSRQKEEILLSQIDYINKQIAAISKLNDSSYINSFTNYEFDDIIKNSEDEISKLSTFVNRNFHYKDKLVSLNDELYDITNEIFKLESEKEEINKNADVIEIALSVLDAAYDEAKITFFPEVSAKTLEIFSQISDSDYNMLIADDKFDISFNKSGIFHSSKYLSRGALDLLYFSFRAAMADMLGDCVKNIPLLLDDIFSNLDDMRAEKLMNYILRLSENKQIILSTCRSREGDYFKNNPNVNIINL